MIKFRRRDEMEQEIENKSIYIAYYSTYILLSIWIIRNLLIKEMAILPLYILIVQFIVKKISELFYKRSVDDDRWRKGLIFLIVIICLIFVFLTVSPVTITNSGGIK